MLTHEIVSTTLSHARLLNGKGECHFTHGMYAKNDNDPNAVMTRTLNTRQILLGGVCV